MIDRMKYGPTSTHTDHPICKCGEQMTRFVRVNTIVRAVEIEDDCEFCGYHKLDPWEIVEPCTRCEAKPGIHKIEDMGIFCDNCVDYGQRVADEEDSIEDAL